MSLCNTTLTNTNGLRLGYQRYIRSLLFLAFVEIYLRPWNNPFHFGTCRDINMRISTPLLPFFCSYTVLLATASSATSPIVDLGYGVYEGYYNSTSDLNIFKGCVRFAALFLQT